MLVGRGSSSPGRNLDGSTALRWWTRSQRIRTEGEVPFEVALYFRTEPPTYQKVADKAMHLSQLGMNSNRISAILKVDRTTITRALRWKKYAPDPDGS